MSRIETADSASPARAPRVLGCAIALLVSALETASPARADDADAAALDARITGLFADVDLGSGRTGKDGLSELGARSLGIRAATGGGWLAAWDAALAAKGGVVGSTLAPTFVVGGRGRLDGGLGLRLQPWRSWSPYVGAHATLALQWLAPPGSDPATGVAVGTDGLAASGRARVDVGGSFLDEARSLVAVAFAQEALRATARSRDAAFQEAGVALRLDVTRRLSASVEASWGATRPVPDAALGLTDRTTHEEATASLRGWISGGTWLGASVTAARDTDRVAFRASGTAYSTMDPPTLAVTVELGFAPRRWR